MKKFLHKLFEFGNDYAGVHLVLASVVFIAILGPFLFSGKSTIGVIVGIALVVALIFGYDKVFKLGIFKKRED